MSVMDEKTLEALEGSINKWEAIVDGTGIDDGPDNCPLCQLFFGGGCEGCPVFESTGRPRCGGTPYTDYVATESKNAAKAELEFLESLLASALIPL